MPYWPDLARSCEAGQDPRFRFFSRPWARSTSNVASYDDKTRLLQRGRSLCGELDDDERVRLKRVRASRCWGTVVDYSSVLW